MRASIEIEDNIVSARLLNKALKDERLYLSRVIIGQPDGTLVYIDASGHWHVVHGTGPQAAQVLAQAAKAMEQITQGIEALAALGTKLQ